MKLKQTLEINGVTTTQESNGEIFGLLQLAQWELGTTRPDLDPLWLQHHSNFLHYLGCLFHAGKVNVFSLQDQVDMKIRWEWVDEGVMATLPEPAPEPAKESIETDPFNEAEDIDFAPREVGWYAVGSSDPSPQIPIPHVALNDSSNCVCKCPRASNDIYRVDGNFFIARNGSGYACTEAYAIYHWHVWNVLDAEDTTSNPPWWNVPATEVYKRPIDPPVRTVFTDLRTALD